MTSHRRTGETALQDDDTFVEDSADNVDRRLVAGFSADLSAIK